MISKLITKSIYVSILLLSSLSASSQWCLEDLHSCYDRLRSSDQGDVYGGVESFELDSSGGLTFNFEILDTPDRLETAMQLLPLIDFDQKFGLGVFAQTQGVSGRISRFKEELTFYDYMVTAYRNEEYVELLDLIRGYYGKVPRRNHNAEVQRILLATLLFQGVGVSMHDLFFEVEAFEAGDLRVKAFPSVTPQNRFESTRQTINILLGITKLDVPLSDALRNTLLTINTHEALSVLDVKERDNFAKPIIMGLTQLKMILSQQPSIGFGELIAFAFFNVPTVQHQVYVNQHMSVYLMDFFMRAYKKPGALCDAYYGYVTRKNGSGQEGHNTLCRNFFLELFAKKNSPRNNVKIELVHKLFPEGDQSHSEGIFTFMQQDAYSRAQVFSPQPKRVTPPFFDDGWWQIQ